MNRVVGIVSTGLLVFAVTAAPLEARSRNTGLWTAVGAGAGFGIGLLVGLSAFDDAINSERKIWTTALVSAAGGGTLGYLVSRGRTRSGAAPHRTAAPLSDREVDALARAVALRARASEVVQSADAHAAARQF